MAIEDTIRNRVKRIETILEVVKMRGDCVGQLAALDTHMKEIIGHARAIRREIGKPVESHDTLSGYMG